jgi:hypothetical protein
MRKARKLGGVLVASSALLGIAGPVSAASAAKLTVKAPSKLDRHANFNVVASGKGNVKHNFLALVFSHVKCRGTLAGAHAAGGNLLATKFVGKTFKVTLLRNAQGGNPGSGFLCTYLYPKSSGMAWVYKSPEALNTHKITWT